MRTRSRLLLAGLAAAVVLCAGVGSASANRLSISERALRFTWAEMTVKAYQTYEGPEEPFVDVTCPVTMEGSFHSSTLLKVVQSLVGYITRATVGTASCTERYRETGTFTFLTETLPWHVKYASFAGTLPRVTEVRLLFAGMALSETRSTVTCLTRSTSAQPAGWRLGRETTSGTLTELRADESIILPPDTGSPFFCEGGRMTYEGTARVARLGRTERVILTLI